MTQQAQWKHESVPTRSTVTGSPLTDEQLHRINATCGHARENVKNKSIAHKIHIRTYGEDLPEVLNWQWTGGRGPQVTTEEPALNAPEG